MEMQGLLLEHLNWHLQQEILGLSCTQMDQQYLVLKTSKMELRCFKILLCAIKILFCHVCITLLLQISKLFDRDHI